MNSSHHVYKKHPKLTTNKLSQLTFLWLRKLFYKGTQRDLNIDDLYETQDHSKSDVLGDKLERNWNHEIERNRKDPQYKPSFLKALVKTFYLSFILQLIFLLFFECVIRVANPYLLGRLILCFDQWGDGPIGEEVFWIAGFLLVGTVLSAIFSNNTQKNRLLFGMRVRIASCSLLYRKLLRLRMSAFSKTSNGQIINLLSNDVNRFDYLFLFSPYFFILPLQVLIITYLTWQTMGVSSLIGVTLLAVQTIPVQGYIGKIAGGFRFRIAKLTDRRVILMNEIISGIQVIKMYAWEQPFEAFVRMARIDEVKVIKLSSYVRGFNCAAMVFTERTTLFFTTVSYALLGNVLTADKAFSLAQYFNVLQTTMALSFPNAILSCAETFISIKRLQSFLELEEQETFFTSEIKSEEKETNYGKPTGEIVISNMTGSWVPNTPVLRQISTRIKPGELCAIIGPVGSGKSSILNAILRELTIEQGSMQVNGTVSYASQEPWLFVGSVRSNILFGFPYDKKKYKRVVHACCLTQDFIQFPYGDQTILGDKGASLSGGQKARINLARTLYRDADIYLLDDPLSAVDTHVGKHLFDECLEFYLRHKTRVLVTHQIQHLQNVNHIIVLHNGRIEAEGTFDELVAKKLEFTKFLETKDNEEEKENLLELRKRLLQRQSTVQSAGEQSDGRPSVVFDKVPTGNEEMETGKLSSKLYYEYLRAGANWCQVFFLLFIMIFAQAVCLSNDYFVSYWTETEEIRLRREETRVVSLLNDTHSQHTLNLTSYNVTGTDEVDDDLLSTKTIIYIYGGLICLVIFVTITRSMYFFKLTMNASVNLHNKMFHTLLQAPMRFFDTNPIGRILNRFSKDVGAVDELLPKAIIECAQVFSVMFGILILISIVNVYMLIPTAFLLVAFLKIRSVFLQTAQDIKRLEGITRSPVFSHISASVYGLTTIRSAGAQNALREEFDGHQNLHTSAWYLTVVCGVALGFWTDMLCTVFFGIITFSFIYLRPILNFTGSQVGLALSQGMILTGMVQYGIKQSVEMVCQMTSVERMLQYTKIEKEGPFDTPDDQKLSKSWPDRGAIEFNKLYMRYTPTTPPVLKNLNLEIFPGEKVGIVGRTGAGKSSLISSLFHLSILDGEILVDGININNIGLKDLRSRISIIPQQPVLFSATMRFNLDPYQQYEDHQLWDVLDEVELKDAVSSLDFQIQGGGSNFSIGQRQLICLARAILKRNKILVLDEATANVDPQTDSLIQLTIREKFAHCTVLTIAHRLNTIMDSDKVLVMDFGQMVEYDHPHKLLASSNGVFTGLVKETGQSMAEHLYSVAREAYYKKYPYLRPANEDDTSSTNL